MNIGVAGTDRLRPNYWQLSEVDSRMQPTSLGSSSCDAVFMLVIAENVTYIHEAQTLWPQNRMSAKLENIYSLYEMVSLSDSPVSSKYLSKHNPYWLHACGQIS